MKGWNGRGVRRLIDQTLATKGTVCVLCGLGGADSADHNPPRQDLLDAGIPDPDHPAYLFPAHLSCNKRRKRRPITPELRAELLAKRLRDLGVDAARSVGPSVGVSSRFDRAREASRSLRAPD